MIHIKEPLFSATGKRGFFLHFWKKQGKYGEIGLRNGRSAASEPDFCVSKGKNAGVPLFLIIMTERATSCTGSPSAAGEHPARFAEEVTAAWRKSLA